MTLSGIYRYARHEDVPAWQDKGWVVVGDLGLPHSLWSVLMRWAGEGEPIDRTLFEVEAP